MNPYDKAFSTRMAVTLISMYVLKDLNGTHRAFLYAMLPFLLAGLDGVDSEYMGDLNTSTRSFDYKIRDKTADVLSYYLSYKIFFPDDKVLLGLILFRAIGVFLFGSWKRIEFLVLFPDLIKEYLLYKAFYGENITAFPVIVPAKILYESWMHLTHNPMNS